MEKYLYFRTQATIGDDDAAGDSAMYPLSSLTGMVPTADDTLAIHFKPIIAVQADGQDGAVVNNDKVIVTLSAVNTHKDVIERLAKLFIGSRDSFISVADDKTSVYAVSGIAGLSTMTAPTLS